MKLQDKVAVITGGNSGIGRATALALAAEGAHVVIFGRDQETLDSTLAELNKVRSSEGHRAVQGDVSTLDDIERLVAEAKDAHGRIDILFANAGIAPMAPLAQMEEDAFDTLFAINVKGVFFTVQKALPLLGEGSSVILTASAVATKGLPGLTAYAATKAAVRSLGRGFAAELAEQSIRVNVLSPGAIETPIYDRMDMDEDAKDDFQSHIESQVAAGRFGNVDEMAATVVFLASSDSTYFTGANLVADGGFSTL